MTAHYTPDGGPRLRVDDSGGPGLPVLFQHGLCGDARQTAEVFPTNASFRRITLECRGHGGSEPGDPRHFSISRFTEDAAGLLDTLRIGPLVVGGISMGSAIALRLAVTRPDLVRGLVIARPAWSMERAPSNMQPNAEVGDLLTRLPPATAQEAFMAGETARLLSEAAPDNLASLMGFFSRAPLDVTAALLTSIAADGPGITAEQLKAICCPVLVIANAMDFVHPLGMAQDIASLIPGASLVEVTPKARDRDAYVAEFRAALNTFLTGFQP